MSDAEYINDVVRLVDSDVETLFRFALLFIEGSIRDVSADVAQFHANGKVPGYAMQFAEELKVSVLIF